MAANYAKPVVIVELLAGQAGYLRSSPLSGRRRG